MANASRYSGRRAPDESLGNERHLSSTLSESPITFWTATSAAASCCWRPSRRQLLAAGSAALPFSLVALCGSHRRPSVAVREEPLKFASSAFPGADDMVSPPVLELVRHRLRWRAEMGVSQLLHWMCIFANPAFPEFEPLRARHVVRLVTDARQIERRFGQRGVIVQTAQGVRYQSRLAGSRLSVNSRPTHPFQELAVFAEIGLPASTPITADTRTLTLADAVRDCLLSVQMRDGMRIEPEWALCVAAYYAAEPVWINRWRERITFNDWASFLLDRDPARFCCAGTHVLSSLGVLLQLQRSTNDTALSRRIAQRVQSRCAEFSALLESRQKDDGSWDGDWMEGFGGRDGPNRKVHISGHLLEAQLFLPQGMRIGSGCVVAGLNYLNRAFGASADDEILREYCPFSHAGRVLLRCAERAAYG